MLLGNLANSKGVVDVRRAAERKFQERRARGEISGASDIDIVTAANEAMDNTFEEYM